jgi:GNAT superfamily N-acetyltransferase
LPAGGRRSGAGLVNMQRPDWRSDTDPQPATDLRIGYLADYPEVLPVLRHWFETEWAGYYGPAGPGDAAQDLVAYSSRETLPVGLVAFSGGQVCGVAALKRDSLGTHTHLSPWAAAGLVAPSFRRKGIGSRLVRALEGVATDLGYSMIYCGTSTAVGLLTRNEWQLIERVRYDGEDVSIYQKAL